MTRRLCLLHTNCLGDIVFMAERKTEPFINGYDYQEGAALQTIVVPSTQACTLPFVDTSHMQ